MLFSMKTSCQLFLAGNEMAVSLLHTMYVSVFYDSLTVIKHLNMVIPLRQERHGSFLLKKVFDVKYALQQ